MIRKLKVRFVVLASAALFVLLLVIVAGIGVINRLNLVSEADEILDLIAQNSGIFPGLENEMNELGEAPRNGGPEIPQEFDPAGRKGGKGLDFPRGMPAETPYESRYFSVLLDENGAVLESDLRRISSVDEESAEAYAREILQSGETRGFSGNLRFNVTAEGKAVRVTFLDCSSRLGKAADFMTAAAVTAFAGFLAVFLIFLFLSGRILRPITESYEKQRRFITDAGHELKTPLTVINANADLLEMDFGPNECLADIHQQTARLTELTNDLVMLSRMEENAPLPAAVDFPASKVVEEAAAAFRAPAEAGNKQFFCTVRPLLSMHGDARSIGRLVTLLLDNAVKYSPEGGTVSVRFDREGKNLVLTVFNTASVPVDKAELEHVFDRFYRTDPSRNSETGGHGIGLSVAKAITLRHGGRIRATTKDGRSFTVTAAFPAPAEE